MSYCLELYQYLQETVTAPAPATVSAPVALTELQKFNRAQEQFQRSSRSAEVRERQPDLTLPYHSTPFIVAMLCYAMLWYFLSQDSGVGKKAKVKSKFAILDDDGEDDD